MTDNFISRYSVAVGISKACAIFGVPARSYRHRAKARQDKATHDAEHVDAGSSVVVAPVASGANKEASAHVSDSVDNNAAVLTPTVPKDPTCRHCKVDHRDPKTRIWPTHPGALSAEEREDVLKLLCSERFIDMAAEQVYWTLLDEGKYYCSPRSMYRILAAHQATGDRRRRRYTPKKNHGVPRLHATAPNQVWAWDVTLLPSDVKGKWFYLYAVIDIFSRKIVGWLIDDCESKENAEKLLRETCHRYGIERDQLTIHADRGAIMKARKVQDLFTRFGVTKSHSRPRVSNDNPMIESFFKTAKYRHDYPLQFATLRAARRWVAKFMRWYNNEHHHSSVAYFHPTQVHDGTWIEAHEQRQLALDIAYRRHPERFNNAPVAPKPPTDVWINQPDDNDADDESSDTTVSTPEEVTPAA